MLGRNTWFTDWRKSCTIGAMTVAIENDANIDTGKSAAATHWSACARKPCSDPEIPKGVAWRTWPVNDCQRKYGPRRPCSRAM